MIKRTIDKLTDEARDLGLKGELYKRNGVYFYEGLEDDTPVALGDSVGHVRQAMFSLARLNKEYFERLRVEALGMQYGVPKSVRELDNDPSLISRRRAEIMAEWEAWWDEKIAPTLAA